jgi:hypothetical protein
MDGVYLNGVFGWSMFDGWRWMDGVYLAMNGVYLVLGLNHVSTEQHWSTPSLLARYDPLLRGGLGFKARRLVASLNSRPRVMKKQEKKYDPLSERGPPQASRGIVRGRAMAPTSSRGGLVLA